MQDAASLLTSLNQRLRGAGGTQTAQRWAVLAGGDQVLVGRNFKFIALRTRKQKKNTDLHLGCCGYERGRGWQEEKNLKGKFVDEIKVL